MSFKWKMSLYISVVTTVILVITSIFVFVTFTRITQDHSQQVLNLKLKNLILHIEHQQFIFEETMNEWTKELDGDQYIKVFDTEGQLLYTTNVDGREGLIAEEQTLISAETLVFTQGIGYLKIRLYQDAKTEEKYIQLILLLLLIGTIGGACIAAFSSYFIARATIKPINKIVQIVQGIEMNDLTQRLTEPRSKDEIHELSHTFNLLLGRVEKGFELQQQFVADASHEFRTPLTAIEGHANLINRWGKNSPDVIDESINYILQETKRMKQLMNQLLISASSLMEQQALDPENTRLLDHIIEAKKQVESIYEERNPVIIVEYEPLIDQVNVKISKLFLQQIMVNVLENAIKYNADNGKITIHIGIEHELVVVSVKDNGIGIGTDDLPHIFERFYRANKSRNKEIDGTGLGLHITRRIVENFGGQIHVQSELGVGTAVTIHFPIGKTIEYTDSVTA